MIQALAPYMLGQEPKTYKMARISQSHYVKVDYSLIFFIGFDPAWTIL